MTSNFHFITLFSMQFAIAILTFSGIVFASSVSTAPTTTAEQPKPGTILIVTFSNGTTKAIHSDSTNIQAVNGGYFISDPSVLASQSLQSKVVSKTVVQQLVSMFVEIRVDDESPPISSEGCGEGFGYHVDDPDPICEPLDKIGQGPPPDQAFCAAIGCPYNPPAENGLPSPPSEPPVEEPEPEDGDNQNEEGGAITNPNSGDGEGGAVEKAAERDEGNQDEGSDGDGGGGGSDEGEGNGAGGDEGEGG